jgi:cell wall-associated NlpC family hydrolase
MTPPRMAVGCIAKTKIAIMNSPLTAAARPGFLVALGRALATVSSRVVALVMSVGLIAGATLVCVPSAQASASFPRLVAFDWARTQAGKPYEYGGTGPNGYDCSGLVWAAYRKAGITLPRTTEEMLASNMFGRTSRPNPGELAFFGSGHVEFVTYVSHLTFGALHPGTNVWWHTWYPGSGWVPTVYLYVKGAH